MGATILALAAGLLASAGTVPALDGRWAGDRMIMTIGPDGATLQSDCAAGAISGPIALDRHGKFNARGNYHVYRGGPQQADVAPSRTVSTFRGRLAGDLLELSISNPGLPVATFKLRRDGKLKLVRCL